MRILEEVVERICTTCGRSARRPMAEMEALADREGVPIVHWEAGRFLAVLCRALDPAVLEVGTAIGYSTLHMAEQLRHGAGGHPGTRPRAGRDRLGSFLARAGVADRVELVEGDALDTIPATGGPVRPPVRRRLEGGVRTGKCEPGRAEADRARAAGGGQPPDVGRGGAARRRGRRPGAPTRFRSARRAQPGAGRLGRTGSGP